MLVSKAIEVSNKIVIKIGTNSLTGKNGLINHKFMDGVAKTVADLINQNKQVVIVSSGAATAGATSIDKWVRKLDINYKQALCAIGQVELMNSWRSAFETQGLTVGQLLLTKEDFDDPHRSLNIRNTLFTLIDENVVPIVNENDTVSYEEISIGDNDNLSALTAVLWSAQLLVLLSDIDGVYTDDPKENPAATRIDTVEDITELRKTIRIGDTNKFGTGGIETKLQAAQTVTRYGVKMILCSSLDGDGSIFGEVK
ncbi:glutamate 5-kinase [Actinomycetota bacterium]|nr:glutamate 5-kinase [Actinomycetota bacterium]